MTWQPYVDTKLVGTGFLDKAAIFDVSGTSVWATSTGFAVAPTEAQTIGTIFENADKPSDQPTSLSVAGEKFIVVKLDGRTLHAKQGKHGVVVLKTGQALLITHYPETVQPGSAINVVETLAQYLISNGY